MDKKEQKHKKEPTKKVNKKKLSLQLRLILLILVIIIAVIIIIVNKNSQEDTQEEASESGIYYVELSDGIKLNNSENIYDSRKIDGLKIANFQITNVNGVSTFLADLTNTNDTEKGGFTLKIKFLDEYGEEITTEKFYVKKLDPHESCTVTISSSTDFVNCYDIDITI